MYQISSKITPFCKYMVPVLFAGMTIPLLLFPDYEFQPLFVFLLNLAFWPFWFCFMAKAQTVFEDNEGLLVKNKNELRRIPYEDIKSVHESGTNNLKIINIYLKSGNEFYFRPSNMSLTSESPVVSRLRSKIPTSPMRQ